MAVDQSDDWFPTTWAGMYQMFQNVLAKIGGYEVALGMTAAESTHVETLCTNALAGMDFYNAASSTTESLTSWRDLLMKGKTAGSTLQVGDAMPAAPVFGVLGAMTATVGIIPQFKVWRRNIVTRAGWTQAIGEDLTLVKTGTSGPTPEGSVAPSLTLTVASTGYKVNVKPASKATTLCR